MVFW
jgi:CRAL/TRIO domain